MPRGELIRSEQKKRARRRPILDLWHAPVVQLNADAGYVKKHRVWVVCGICAENHVEIGTVVDDNGYKLKDVDWN
jgi:hypothetical protein